MFKKRKGQLQKIDAILGAGLARRGLRQAVRASLICHWASEILQELFPKKTAGISAVSYKNSGLKLRCADAFIATQVKMRETQILEKLNEKCGCSEVKRISFKIGDRD